MMKRKRINVVILPVLIIVFCTVVYLKYSTHTQPLVVKNVETNSMSPVPTGAGVLGDPTSWTQYTFTNVFRISYPPRWEVVPSKDGNGVAIQTPYFHQDDDFTMPYGDSTSVSYSIFGQTDLSDMSFKNGDQFHDDQTQETDVVTNVAHMQIDGLPAVEFDYSATDNTHFIKTRIAVQKGNRLYRFDGVYSEQSGKTLFEEMLHSLHFVG